MRDLFIGFLIGIIIVLFAIGITANVNMTESLEQTKEAIEIAQKFKSQRDSLLIELK